MNIRIRILALAALAALAVVPMHAQTTGSGTLNVTLQNGSGLVMLLYSDSNGVTLTNSGSNAATLSFGTVGAYGSLPTNVTRTNQTNTFTVSTYFDVNVQDSGITSSNYTLSAKLASTAPTGVTIQLGSITLTTSSQNISTTNAYGTNVQQTLSAVISTAASGSGGPTTGTQLSDTIDLVATSN